MFNKESRPFEGRESKTIESAAQKNRLFFFLDLVKEALEAFHVTDEDKRAESPDRILEICRRTKNVHFEWYMDIRMMNSSSLSCSI